MLAGRGTTARRTAACLLLLPVLAACSDDEPAPLTSTSAPAETPSEGPLPEVEGVGDVCAAVDPASLDLLVPDGSLAPETVDSAGEVLETCTVDNGLPAEQQVRLVVSVTTATYLDPDDPAGSVAAACGDAAVTAADDTARCTVPEADDAAEVHGARGDRLVSVRLQNGFGTGVPADQLTTMDAVLDELLGL